MGGAVDFEAIVVTLYSLTGTNFEQTARVCRIR